MFDMTYPIVTEVSDDIDPVLQAFINDLAYRLYGVPESPVVFNSVSNITSEIMMTAQQQFGSYATDQVGNLLNLPSGIYSAYADIISITRVYVKRGGPSTITTGIDLSVEDDTVVIEKYFDTSIQTDSSMSGASEVVVTVESDSA